MNHFATQEYAELRERMRQDGRTTTTWADEALFRAVEEKLQCFCKLPSLGASEDDGDGFSVLGLDDFEVTFRLRVKLKAEAGRADERGVGFGGVLHRLSVTAEVRKGKLKSYWVTDETDRRRRRFRLMPGWGRSEDNLS